MGSWNVLVEKKSYFSQKKEELFVIKQEGIQAIKKRKKSQRTKKNPKKKERREAPLSPLSFGQPLVVPSYCMCVLLGTTSPLHWLACMQLLYFSGASPFGWPLPITMGPVCLIIPAYLHGTIYRIWGGAIQLHKLCERRKKRNFGFRWGNSREGKGSKILRAKEWPFTQEKRGKNKNKERRAKALLRPHPPCKSGPATALIPPSTALLCRRPPFSATISAAVVHLLYCR